MKKCQKCAKEKENVEDYCFYIGKTVGYDVKGAGFRQIQTTTSYQILPKPIYASICDDCINSRIQKYWLLSFGIMLCLVVLIYFELIALFFLLLVVTIIVTISVTSKKADIGDSIAIGLNKTELYKQGFNSFFTRSKHSELQGKNPFL